MDSELREHVSKIATDLRMHIPPRTEHPAKLHSVIGSRNSEVRHEGTEPCLRSSSSSLAKSEAKEVLPCGADAKFQRISGHAPEVPRCDENWPATDHNSCILRRKSINAGTEEVLPCGPDVRFQHIGGHTQEVPRGDEDGSVTDHNGCIPRRESINVEDTTVVCEPSATAQPERELIVSPLLPKMCTT